MLCRKSSAPVSSDPRRIDANRHYGVHVGRRCGLSAAPVCQHPQPFFPASVNHFDEQPLFILPHRVHGAVFHLSRDLMDNRSLKPSK